MPSFTSVGRCLGAVVCIMLGVSPVLARPAQPPLPIPSALPVAAAKADEDTFFLYGGPGSPEGRFENLAGDPDWQGWTGADYSTGAEAHWHASTTGAQNLAASRSWVFVGQANLADPNAHLGRAVAVGDLNGDGHDDVIVGAPTTAAGGEVLVFFGGQSPDTGYDLRISGNYATVGFGRSVASGGDLNGDGWDDLVVGIPGSPVAGGTGRVYVYYGGPTMDTVADRFLTGAVDSLGLSVAIIGDMDHDGYDDVAVGAVDVVHVYRGGTAVTSPPDYELMNPAGVEGAAMLVCRIGDFDNNALDDLLVGVPASDGGNGKAYVWRSAELFMPGPDEVLGTELTGLRLGTSIAGLGDLNGDGFTDVAVGTDGAAGGVGYVWIWHGRNDWEQHPAPAMFLSRAGPAGTFGRAVAGPGDLDGDGWPDLVVAEPVDQGLPSGVLRVYRGGPGMDAAADAEFRSAAVVNLGSCLASGPCDFDADGRADVLAGAPDPASPGHAVVWTPPFAVNQAAYCGVESGEPGYVHTPGYGDRWSDNLVWYWDVPDAGATYTVRIVGRLNHSLEEGYDFLGLQHVRDGGVVTYAGWTGTAQGVPLDLQFPASAFVIDPDTGLPAIALRFAVTTDGAVSDQDGAFDSVAGAAQVDNLVVSIDGVVRSSATFEPALGNDPRPGALNDCDSGGWLARPAPACGDFTKLISGFVEADPARDNPSPQVAFMDTGEPPANDPWGVGTGGTASTLPYGVPMVVAPYAWAGLNTTGGLAALDPDPPLLANEVRSPVIAIDDPLTPDDDFWLDLGVRFDVWMDLPLNTTGRMFACTVRVRDYAVARGWSAWKHDFIHYADVPMYRTLSPSLASLLAADATHLQVALGVVDTDQYGSTPPVSRPGPAIDNVSVWKTPSLAATAPLEPGVAQTIVFPGGLTVTVGGVTVGGELALLETMGVEPSPFRFRMALDPAVSWEISTNALYTGPVSICLDLSRYTLAVPGAAVSLLHYQETPLGPAWVDVTTSLEGMVLCGQTSHLSPFCVGVADPLAGVEGPPPAVRGPRLLAPYPNPFNPATSLRFSLDAGGPVTLRVYDVGGRLVRTLLADVPLAAGEHAAAWDGRDGSGRTVAAGVYVCRLEAAGRTLLGRMTLLK